MRRSDKSTKENSKKGRAGRIRRILFRCTLLLLLLLISLPILLPRVIDSDYIRDSVFSLLGQELGHRIEADHIAVTLFPRPGFRLEGVTLHLGTPVDLDMKTALLFPDFGTFFHKAPHPLTGEFFFKRAALTKVSDKKVTVPSPLKRIKSGTIKTIAVHFSYTSLQHFSLNIRGADLHIGLNTAEEQSMAIRSFLTEIKKDSEQFTVDFKPTQFNSPAMIFGVRFQRDSTASRLSFTGEDVPIAPLRKISSSLLRESRIATTLFHIVRDGFVPHIIVNFQNNNDNPLFDPKKMVIQGKIRHGTIAVPATPLVATDVSATVSVKEGILFPRLTRAMVGNSRLKQGHLQVDLLKEKHPFQGKFSLTADLGELPGILQSLMPDTLLSHELILTEKTAGTATGTLELTRTAGRLSVEVHCSDIHVSGIYQRFPGNAFHLQGDDFTFSNKKITIDGFKGTIGDSRLSDVSGAIELTSPHRLDLYTTDTVFSLQELLPWLTRFTPLISPATPLLSSQGTLTLDRMRLQGPLFVPKEWDWEVQGSCTGGAAYEGPPGKGISDIALTFDLSPGHFTVKDLTATIHDTTPLMEHATFLSAFPGGKALVADLHTPIALSNATLEKNSDHLTFRAKLAFPDGVSLGVTVNNRQGKISLKKLEIDDSPLSNCTMAYPAKAVSVFKGKLDLDTVKKCFAPESATARHLTIPGSQGRVALVSDSRKGAGATLFLDRLDLKTFLHATGTTGATPAASDNTAEPDSAFLQTEEARKKGQPLTRNDNAPDDSAPEIARMMPHADQVPSPLIIHANTLALGNFSSTPFIFKISTLSPSMEGIIQESNWCGLPVTGEIGRENNALQVTLKVDAQNVDFITTLNCLMGDTHLIEGRYDLKASLFSNSPAKAPSPEKFPCQFQGNFELYARDGRIFQMTLLSRALSLINVSSLLKAKLPDLVQHGFAYETMIFKGEISENRIFIKKGIINGVDMTLAITGWLDPLEKTMDLLFFISPLKSVDSLIRKLPVINTMFKGDLISIPITAKGPLHDPVVMALPPLEITKGLFNTLKDILTTPLTLLKKTPLKNQSDYHKGERAEPGDSAEGQGNR